MSTHVIVGAGQAGACAAVAMRKAGFGGRVVLIGGEADLPYERPPLSKSVLNGDDAAAPPAIYSKACYDELAIETCFGVEAIGADPITRLITLSNGEEIAFDQVLIATGGRARRLDILGGEHALSLRTKADAHEIQRHLKAGSRLICVGAGVVGMELAAVAQARGCKVVVVEAGASIMARALNSDMQRFIEEAHREVGVCFHFNARPSRVEILTTGCKRLVMEDGRAIEADLIVAGIGMVRSVEIARQLQVDVDNGVLVDEFGQTNRAGVFAAGDVAAFWHPGLGRRMRLEAWRHAQNHGIAVGRNMCGADMPYQDLPWFWTDQYDLHIQVIGTPQDAHQSLYRSGEKPRSFVVYHLGEDGVVVGATAVNEPRGARSAQKFISSKHQLPETLMAECSGVSKWM